jgi:hypothetical protein
VRSFICHETDTESDEIGIGRGIKKHLGYPMTVREQPPVTGQEVGQHRRTGKVWEWGKENLTA